LTNGYRKLSILMPVYNEARTLRRIVKAVLDSPIDLEIELICVDDASMDSTPQILAELAAKDPRIKVVTHPVNRGKGAAIRSAIEHITGDIAIVQDADLEYDPREYPIVLAPILEGKADAVFGSRFAAASQRKVLLYWHSVANKLLTWVTNILNDINITDMETCYKAVRADILKQIPLKSDRFGIEPELTTRLAQWNIRIYEVPISYHGRSLAEGKKIGWKDAVSAMWCLFKYRFIDRRFTTHDGYYVLQSVRRARGFNKWMLSTFRPYIGERVYEAGCGIGNFTELLLDRDRLVCADYDNFYVEMLSRRFGHLENVRTLHMDLAAKDATRKLLEPRPPVPPPDGQGQQPEILDTVISLNVIEHIEDDAAAIRHFHDILEPGGHAIVLVPAHPRLYTECDRALGHFRRYTEEELRAKFRGAGFEIASVRQFNRLGVFGWWLNGKLGRKDLSPFQMRVYELMLPIAKLMDRVRAGPGLSLVIVGRKPVGEPPVGEPRASRPAVVVAASQQPAGAANS
jgi:glycosyltransferase involved in cell wall biosynthesis